jgi:hypothetical protein
MLANRRRLLFRKTACYVKVKPEFNSKKFSLRPTFVAFLGSEYNELRRAQYEPPRVTSHHQQLLAASDMMAESQPIDRMRRRAAKAWYGASYVPVG